MSEEQNDARVRRDRDRRRRRKRRREERARAPEGEEAPEVELDAGERAYREARKLAERKVKLARDALGFAIITTLLLIFVPFVGVIVLLWWGFGLASEFYKLQLEPRLRERFVQSEVEKQVRVTLSQERQALEGRHARSLEELSASIAHEIRNPITAAKSLVQQMEEDPTASENVEYARVALEELHRVERSVSHLLRFARDEDASFTPLRLSEVIDSALETFRDRVSRTGLELDRQLDCEGAMVGDPEKLRRVFINLVGNAMDALAESATPGPRIEVQMGENLAGTEIWIQIRDNGPGIDADTLSKIWSPFYTSKANGTGLGLAITKKLVDTHGGRIEVRSDPGQGTEFLLTFPKRPHAERAANGADGGAEA